jgi:tetratricopeptide (TPR) repeat protein
MTLGRVYLSTGRLDEAVRCLQEALALSPGFSYARGHLGHAWLLQHRHEEALAEFRQAVVTGAASDRAQLAYAYAVTDQRAAALDIVRDLLAPERGQYAPPLHMAMAYVGLGDPDEAFGWLERAVDEHDPHVLGLNIIPAFRPLHPDPRFRALVQRIGLLG